MNRLKVVTYNIHKGVQGLGPMSRLQIHDLGLAIEQLDADLVFLQEVRAFNHAQAKRFSNWPEIPQADFLAPLGYHAVYQTNAYTRHGEHGNALLSRWPVLGQFHHNISDHRFEQRGLLHVVLNWQNLKLHAIVVHLGLLHGSRIRQIAMLHNYLDEKVPHHEKVIVAGDFNDWGSSVTRMMRSQGFVCQVQRTPTFPSRLPLTQLDHVYVRGLMLEHISVPMGKIWARLSDHLPLQATLRWESEP
jgi:endonuclease/exonuclease/phosphatase family metal-dependent hydrolase